MTEPPGSLGLGEAASAGPGPLRLGRLLVDPPVVLAPMAGVTNRAFRRLCREQGAGLYVCEMITSRGIVERDPKTWSMLRFDRLDGVRSVQLYGVEPTTIAEAVRALCDEMQVRHVDLNFGCPVPKVTRRGGGAALPWKRSLLAAIVSAAVAAAAEYDVPVTVKTRLGIDDAHLTYLDAGRIAQDCGAAAVALHARTAAQHYSGQAHWPSIAALVSALDIPVLGNGDIWEARDAIAMTRATGCAGVVVGRGCLGRPWLFADLAAAFSGAPAPPLPTLGQVADTLRRHAQLLAEDLGEPRGCCEIRKHVAWYLKGYPVGPDLRVRLASVQTLRELEGLLDLLDRHTPFPTSELGHPRGRQGSPRRRVALPAGWLDDTDGADLSLAEAVVGVSGG